MSRSQYALAIVILALFGFLGGMVSGRLTPGRAEASNDGVITARTLIIQDADGNNLVTIGSPEAGQAVLAIQDPKEKSGILLGLNQGEPLIRVSNGNDLTTDIYPKGCTILDGSGPVSIWGISAEGNPNIAFFRNKKPVASFGRIDNGGAQMVLLDQVTQNASIMGYAKAGEKVQLVFANMQNGNQYWEAP